ncbi:MAG: hypothetical protein IJL52_03325 [Clostridia bacterium]|nr:hypothetical protein [Clostridia bacterium]
MDNSTINFTERYEDVFYDTVDTETFQDEDADAIYARLQQKIHLIPFGDYLKRYLYQKASLTGRMTDVPLHDYQEIIVQSFAANQTPKSFTETSAKLSALAKNWLTQRSVKRQVIFLLGFGLNMTVRDVSEFLTHAQRERDFNFKNPFEIICWYCYRNGYGYPKFRQLLAAYDALPSKQVPEDLGATISLRDEFMAIETERDLLRKLAQLKIDNCGQLFSVSAKAHFDGLYAHVRTIILDQYQRDAILEAEERAKAYYFSVSRSPALTYEEKFARAERIRTSPRIWKLSEITEADVEKFLCCGIPYDKKGNLLRFSQSTLAVHFNNKRMSRQHLHDIRTRRVDVDRFDLLTLLFFVYAMDEKITNNKTRYIRFVDQANRMLQDCCMDKLYIANPYECFLLMCILSDAPMGTYADVLERSYEELE